MAVDPAQVGTPNEDPPAKSGRGHAALYMAPILVQAVLPIVTLPIFTRILIREEYGLWGISTALGVVLTGIAGLGLHVGYERNYFAATETTARGRLLWSVTLFALTMQLVTLVMLLLARREIATRLLGSPDSSYLLVLGFGTAAVSSLKAYFLTTLRNEGRAKEYVRYSVDELFLGVVLSLIAVVWLRWGAAGLIVGPLTAATVVAGALVTSFARRTQFGLDGAQLRDTLRVSLPLAPRALIGAIGSQLDRLVLGAVGSLSAVGVYTIGQRMAQLVFAFMTALQNVYQPAVYRMLFAAAPPGEIGAFLLPYAYASVGISVAAILFSRDIVAIVAPAAYADAALIVAILSVYYALLFFGKQPQLIFARRTGLTSILSAFAVVFNAGGIYLGALLAGGPGVAMGLLAAGVLTGTVGFLLALKFAPIWYPLRATVAIFAAPPAALAIVLVFRELALPWAPELALKLLLFVGFAMLGWRHDLISAVWRGAAHAAR